MQSFQVGSMEEWIKTEEPTIHYKVQELQNAENAPQRCWAGGCPKSFHGHCVQSKTKYISQKDAIFFQDSFQLNSKKMQSWFRKCRTVRVKNEELPIMSENKESPEHGSLSCPVEWPDIPIVKVNGCSCHCKYDNQVPQHIAEGPPWVLDPTVFGNGGSDLSYLEWRRSTWVEICIVVFFVVGVVDPIDTLHGFGFNTLHCS